MANNENIIEVKIDLFFNYVDAVLNECEKLLENNEYSSRKDIVKSTLFALLSLLATSYCCGKERKGLTFDNKNEFTSFLENFWISKEKARKYNLDVDLEHIPYRSPELLWQLRCLSAHQFRDAGMAFPSKSDKDVIVICQVENHNGVSNSELEVNPHSFLKSIKCMNIEFRKYCQEKMIDPRSNLPYKHIFVN
jgi:hypothetical protein